MLSIGNYAQRTEKIYRGNSQFLAILKSVVFAFKMWYNKPAGSFFNDLRRIRSALFWQRPKPAVSFIVKASPRSEQGSNRIGIWNNIKKRDEKGDKMECGVFHLGSFPSYRYVVIFSEYNGKLLLSRHRERTTFETQGGHIEPGESPQAAAARELWEESGAEDFSMEPLFDYWAEDSVSGASGVVFYARIKKLASLPPWEMGRML